MKAAVLLASTLLFAPACDQVTSVPPPPNATSITGWTVLAAGTANLNGVSGVSDTAVWAVGDQGTIVHWDGSRVTFEKSGTNVTLRGVHAISTDEVYAVGDQGTILHRKSGAWTSVGQGTTPQALTAVYADTARVVAVGSYGTVVLGLPMGMTMKYSVVPNSDTENLLGVSGSPGQNVTAVGALGLVLQVSTGGGGSLSRVAIPAFSELLAGAAVGPGATYYVGQLGSVYRVDGSGLNPVAGCPLTSLRAVSVTTNAAWVVGWDGTICEIAGATVSSFPYVDQRWFNGVYAASATALWVVGASGTLLHGFPKGPDAGGLP